METFWDAILPYLEVLLPTIVIALIFWFVMRAVFNADRREREAEQRVTQEYDERLQERIEELRAQRRDGAEGVPDADVASSGREVGREGARGGEGDSAR